MGGGAAGGLSNNGRHLGFYQKLEIPPKKKKKLDIRLKPREMVIYMKSNI